MQVRKNPEKVSCGVVCVLQVWWNVLKKLLVAFPGFPPDAPLAIPTNRAYFFRQSQPQVFSTPSCLAGYSFILGYIYVPCHIRL